MCSLLARGWASVGCRPKLRPAHSSRLLFLLLLQQRKRTEAGRLVHPKAAVAAQLVQGRRQLWSQAQSDRWAADLKGR
eukprot:COSAG02_NODE_1900_length_10458_cov_4.285838_2_plen_78_part_00